MLSDLNNLLKLLDRHPSQGSINLIIGEEVNYRSLNLQEDWQIEKILQKLYDMIKSQMDSKYWFHESIRRNPLRCCRSVIYGYLAFLKSIRVQFQRRVNLFQVRNMEEASQAANEFEKVQTHLSNQITRFGILVEKIEKFSFLHCQLSKAQLSRLVYFVIDNSYPQGSEVQLKNDFFWKLRYARDIVTFKELELMNPNFVRIMFFHDLESQPREEVLGKFYASHAQLDVKGFKKLTQATPVPGEIAYELESLRLHPLNNFNLADFKVDSLREILFDYAKSHRIQANLEAILQLSIYDEGFVRASSNAAYLLNLLHVNFNDFELKGLKLCDVNISGGNFIRTNLSYSAFLNVNIAGCDFTDANLGNANWSQIRAIEFYNFPSCKNKISCLASSPDGSKIVSSNYTSREIKFWKLQGGTLLGNLVGHTGPIYCVSFSPNGFLLASGGKDANVKIWNLRSLKLVRVLGKSQLPQPINAVQYTSDGHFIVSASGSAQDEVTMNNIIVWSATNGNIQNIIDEHNRLILSISIARDKMLFASNSHDNTVRFWDLKTGKKLATISEHQYAICLSPDGEKLYSTGDNGTKQWDLSALDDKGQLKLTAQSISTSINSQLAISFDSNILALFGNAGILQLWNLNDKVLLKKFKCSSGSLNQLTFTAKGQQLITSGERFQIKLLDLKELNYFRNSDGPDNQVTCLALSGDGQYLAAGVLSNSSIMLWDAPKGRLLTELKGHSDGIQTLAFSSQIPLLASGSRDKTIRLWDAVKGESLFVLQGHQSFVRKICFSKNGELLVSGSEEGTIKLWNIKSRTQVQSTHKKFPILALAISPNNQKIIYGGGIVLQSDFNKVHVWNLEEANGEHSQLEGHQNLITMLTFSQDGSMIFSGSLDGSIRIWCTQNLSMIKVYQKDLGPNSCLFLLNFDKHILSAGLGNKGKYEMCINRLKNKKAVWRKLLNPVITTSDLSSDGTRLATAHQDLSIRLWNIKFTQNKKKQLKFNDCLLDQKLQLARRLEFCGTNIKNALCKSEHNQLNLFSIGKV